MLSKLDLELLRQDIATRLCRMQDAMFAPEMMLTFVARHPTNPECFIVVTSDGDLAAVAELLTNGERTDEDVG